MTSNYFSLIDFIHTKSHILKARIFQLQIFGSFKKHFENGLFLTSIINMNCKTIV